jgi:hypothetical protein
VLVAICEPLGPTGMDLDTLTLRCPGFAVPDETIRQILESPGIAADMFESCFKGDMKQISYPLIR